MHLRGIENGQRVAGPHEVAFLDADLLNASGHLARHAIFGYFNLSLNDLRVAVEGQESYEGYDGYDDDEAEDGHEDIVVLFLCLFFLCHSC